MSVKEENELLKMVIAMQLSRIREHEETFRELRSIIAEIHSMEVILKETLEEFKRKMFGMQSEKTSFERQDELYAGLPVTEIPCSKQ